jgi:serine/threonine protein kinase
MDDAKLDIRAIFCEALDRQSPEELTQYLDTACGDNADLRAQVEELLASHRAAGKFLGGASAKTSETIDHSMAEKLGMVIGPYKLRQVIGEGGMGTVYMAEQTEPIERKVALKVIKAGMDTQQVIARFEAERQALAMMDHANIARVLDVGTTQSGRPYFVMELVQTNAMLY